MMTILWCLILVMLVLALGFIYWPLRSMRRVWLIVVLVLLSAAALGLYRYWGDSQGLAAFYQQQDRQAMVTEFLDQYDSPEQVINMLKTRLQADPDSAEGWYLLGRLYFSQQDYQPAAQAFATANSLDADDPQILMQYAQALYYVQGGDLSGKPTALLAEILSQDADNVEALNLMAVGAYQQDDYIAAIDLWQRILDQQPPAETRQALQQALANAEKALRELAQSEPAQNPLQLTINVRLADELQAKLVADDVLTIYAKAVNGPPMPLAVVQKQGRDLPLQITLDDSMAMLPNLYLSKFEQVIVYARLGKTAQAESTKGDLIGQSDIIKPAQQIQEIALIIDSVIS